MRKAILILALLFSSIAFADFSVGLNLDFSNRSDISSDAPDNNANSDYYIRPYLGIHASDLIEKSPFFVTYFDINGGEVNFSQYGFGCGVFFHMVRNELFHLSLGPELEFLFGFRPNNAAYSSYFDMDINLGAPLNLDIHINKLLGVRLSSNIIGFGWEITNIEYENANQPDEKYRFMTTSLKTIFDPSFTIFFKF